jgi:uncharacterized protein
MVSLSLFAALAAVFPVALSACPDYSDYSQQHHAPFSSGKYNLSYMRPDPSCRTFRSAPVDNLIQKYSGLVKDPDLYRLFQNSCMPIREWANGKH